MNTLIVAISAKNIHKSLAPWCLKAYCDGRGISDIEILETNINDNIQDITAKIFSLKPDVTAFSCYIWNIEYVKKIGVILKQLLPNTLVILGGPEVSFEKDLSGYPFADYIVSGAGESAFYELLIKIKDGKSTDKNIIEGGKESFGSFESPYTDGYFESFKTNQIPKIENQLIYYESTRGCPFSCAYCLSSACRGVQALPLEHVKADLIRLVQKGAKCIKFVDRTFNFDKKRACEIFRFVQNLDTDCTFHFEAGGDLFDEEMLEIIAKMPIARVQFEIGVQSVNDKTLESVNRKTDTDFVFHNIEKLASLKTCHVHVDLIAGLPHETLSSFKTAVDRCIQAKPQMLQLGFLKMLKGSPLRQNNDFGAVFAAFPPYEVYQTDTMQFSDIITLKRIESVIERFYNSGAFAASIEVAITKIFKSAYKFFDEFSMYCNQKNINTRVSMKNAYTVLMNFLLEYLPKEEAEHYIKLDCLSFDSKGVLPDQIKLNQNKAAEQKYKSNEASIRVEYFEFDNTKRLFIYNKRNPISNRYDVTVI